METTKKYTLITAGAIIVAAIIVAAVILVPGTTVTPAASTSSMPTLAMGSPIAPPKPAPQKGTPVATGNVIVQYKSGLLTSPAAGNIESEVNAEVGATLVQASTVAPGLTTVQLPIGASVDQAIAQLKTNPAVEGAWPVVTYNLTAMPNDPALPFQWALSNTGQSIPNVFGGGNVTGTPGDDINVSAAWNVTTGSSNVIVAVADSGVQTDHPDLAANIGPGYDFYSNSSNPDPLAWNDSGHGTMVAGIIGAVTNNAIGVAGVNWNVTIMPLQVDDPSLGAATNYMIAEAIIYAQEHGASIMNLSLGGGGGSDPFLLQTMQNSTMLFVCSAGNYGTNNDQTPVYPASFNLPNIISVAASDSNDNLANFSCYGATTVNLAAPGVNVLSTFYQYNYGYGFMYGDGTSFSAPLVTGVAALIKAEHPDYGYAQIKSAILNTVDPKPGLAGKVSTGGELDAGAAVLYNASGVTNSTSSVTNSTSSVTNSTSSSNLSSEINAYVTQQGMTIVTPFQQVMNGNTTEYIGSYKDTQGDFANCTIIPTDSVATAQQIMQNVIPQAQQNGWTETQGNTTVWLGQNTQGQYLELVAANLPAIGGNPGFAGTIVTPAQQTGSASLVRLSAPDLERVVVVT
jgi:subtilisin family serine protease